MLGRAWEVRRVPEVRRVLEASMGGEKDARASMGGEEGARGKEGARAEHGK